MPNLRTLTLARCLAACLALSSLSALADPVWIYSSTDATPGPLGLSWTGSWSDGWDIFEGPSDVTIDGNTLSYNYPAGGSWAGTPTQTFMFSTTAAQAGTLSLNIDLSSNMLWDGSATSMYIWEGDTTNAQLLAGATGDAIVPQSVTLNLAQDEAWGFLAVSGSIGDDMDYTGPVYGAFTVTDASTSGEVPEPASLALLGLGALGLVAVRRKV